MNAEHQKCSYISHFLFLHSLPGIWNRFILKSWSHSDFLLQGLKYVQFLTYRFVYSKSETFIAVASVVYFISTNALRIQMTKLEFSIGRITEANLDVVSCYFPQGCQCPAELLQVTFPKYDLYVTDIGLIATPHLLLFSRKWFLRSDILFRMGREYDGGLALLCQVIVSKEQ